MSTNNNNNNNSNSNKKTNKKSNNKSREQIFQEESPAECSTRPRTIRNQGNRAAGENDPNEPNIPKGINFNK
jgi:hypothetical protein